MECGGVAGSPCAGVRSVCGSPSVSRSDCRVRAWDIFASVAESARQADDRELGSGMWPGMATEYQIHTPLQAAEAGGHDECAAALRRPSDKADAEPGAAETDEAPEVA